MEDHVNSFSKVLQRGSALSSGLCASTCGTSTVSHCDLLRARHRGLQAHEDFDFNVEKYVDKELFEQTVRGSDSSTKPTNIQTTDETRSHNNFDYCRVRDTQANKAADDTQLHNRAEDGCLYSKHSQE